MHDMHRHLHRHPTSQHIVHHRTQRNATSCHALTRHAKPHHAALHYAMTHHANARHGTALHRIIHQCTVLHRTALHHTTQHRTALQAQSMNPCMHNIMCAAQLPTKRPASSPISQRCEAVLRRAQDEHAACTFAQASWRLHRCGAARTGRRPCRLSDSAARPELPAPTSTCKLTTC